MPRGNAMRPETRPTNDGYWTNLPALARVERLEAACHRVMLPAGGAEARQALKQMLPLDLGRGLDPESPAASAARAGADQISGLIAILEETDPDSLTLRVAAARLCQTLANMRGHLNGGRRISVASERRMR